MTGPSPALASPSTGGVPLLEARSLTKHFPVGQSRFATARGVVHAADEISLKLPGIKEFGRW